MQPEALPLLSAFHLAGRQALLSPPHQYSFTHTHTPALPTYTDTHTRAAQQEARTFLLICCPFSFN